MKGCLNCTVSRELAEARKAFERLSPDAKYRVRERAALMFYGGSEYSSLYQADLVALERELTTRAT